MTHHFGRAGKFRGAILGAVAVIALMSGPGVSAAQVDLPKLIKQIQPAVVTVIGYDAQRRIIRLGSGFFINQQGHLITNVHVLAGVSQAEVKTLAGGRYPLKTVLAEDRRLDLIKLAVELPQGPPPIFWRSAPSCPRWESGCW